MPQQGMNKTTRKAELLAEMENLRQELAALGSEEKSEAVSFTAGGSAFQKEFGQENLFKHLFDKLIDGISILSPDLTIAYTNETMRKWFHDHLPLEGKKCYEVYESRTSPCESCPSLRSVQTGKPEAIAKRAPIYENEDGWIELSAYPLYDEKGELEYVIENIKDISKQKQYEEELSRENKANQLLATLGKELIKSSSIEEVSDIALEDALHMTGSEFGFVGYIEQDTGYLVCPTMTRGIWDQCNVPDKSIVFREFGGLWGWVLTNKESILVNNPKTDPRSSGVPQGHLEIRRFLSVPAIIHGKLVGQIALANSEREYTAKDLDNIERLADLYALSVDRKMRDEMLRKAEEDAIEANNLKTNLLMNMSHEIRTPINGITGFADILHEYITDDPRHRRYVERIQQSAERLLNSLDSVITYSTLVSSRPILDVSRISLNGLFAELVVKYTKAAGYKNLEFRYEPPGEEIHIKANDHTVRQIFVNLLDNAVKFTSEGYIAVKMRIDDSSAQRSVEIAIEDTGIGISAEHQQRIFEPFRQASEGLNRAYEGTGLGLSIVNRSVELLKGKVRVESVPDKGSCFTVRLPVIELAEDVRLTEPGTPEKTPETEKPGHQRRVLIVEDNEINVELMTIYLEEDFIVDAAPNGRDALVLAEENAYDYILMDINLGLGIDGIETAKVIGDLPLNAETPVIAVTGYSQPEDKKRILNSGFAGYIAKPFEKEDLIELLQSLRS